MKSILNNRGATSLEYAGVGGVLTLAVVAGLTVFSDTVETAVCTVSENVSLSIGSQLDLSCEAPQEIAEAPSIEEPEIPVGTPSQEQEEPFEPPQDRTWYTISGRSYQLSYSSDLIASGNDIFPGSPALMSTNFAQLYALDQAARDLCSISVQGSPCRLNISGLPEQVTLRLDGNGADIHYSGFANGNFTLDLTSHRSRSVVSLTPTGGSSDQFVRMVADNNNSVTNFFIGAASGEFIFKDGFFINSSIDIPSADAATGEYILIPALDANQPTTVRFFNTASNFIRIDKDHPNSQAVTFICRYNENNGYDEIEAVSPTGSNTV